MGLVQRLAEIARAMPEGSAVVLDVDWIRSQLKANGDLDIEEGPIRDWTVEEVAAELGRSASTVRGWCRSGIFSGAYKLRGREWRIPPAALRSLRQSNRSGDGPSSAQTVTDRGLGAWREHLESRW